MNHRSTGSDKEKLARRFLETNGVRILAMNYHFHRMGEIDLIGVDGKYLVFFEVKYRKSKDHANPLEAVNLHKQVQISRVSDGFRAVQGRFYAMPVRFDVIGVTDERIRWVKNAFPYAGDAYL